MIDLLKTLSIPFLLILPWVLMKLNNWEKVFLQKIINQPFDVIWFLFPGFLFFVVWAINLISKSKLRRIK